MTYPLPLNSIVGIGGKLWRKFENMNILTIGEFVNLDESIIKTIMGKIGLELQAKLKGELIEPVACYYNLAPPKSIGNGTTTLRDIQTRKEVEKTVALLCEKIAMRMTRGKFEARTIAVTVKTNEFEKFWNKIYTSLIDKNTSVESIVMRLEELEEQYRASIM